MRYRNPLAVCAAILLAGTPPARGQATDFVPVDRIVAIVGKTPIPLSRIREEINLMRQRGSSVPTDSAELDALHQSLLERLINDQLVVQEAFADTSIKVADRDVLDAVEQSVRNVRQGFASELDFQRQLRSSGFGTLDEYRRWFAEQKLKELATATLFEKLRQRGQLRPVMPTEAELREFWDENRTRQRRPATVTFRQIVVRPKPDSIALVAARARADSILGVLRRGADFETVAKQASDDIGTRERGGDLGWFRRGMMVREFEAVAFRMRPGQISPVVRTPFGFHIIQVQRSEPAEVNARHILVSPALSEANQEQARVLADSIRAQLEAGAPFDSLARLYNDPGEETLAEEVPRTRLPPAYAEAFSEANPSDVFGPIPVALGAGRTKYAVIVFLEERPEGEMNFEELRDQIRSRLAEENAIKRYVQTLREKTYVEVKY